MTASIRSLNIHDPSSQDENSSDELEGYATRLNARYGDLEALDILRAVIEQEFRGRIALVSSFGAEAIVLLHLVSQIDPKTPVIFLDTQKHFAQTLSYRNKIMARLKLENVISMQPDQSLLDEHDKQGNLWRHHPDQCCDIRKVRPLASVLKNYDAWITGRKQFHGGKRLKLSVFDVSKPRIKVNPLTSWMPEDIALYKDKYDLPAHPLVAQGYPSIGCWPCTHPVAEGGDDVRAGRWRGAAKTECGIHEN